MKCRLQVATNKQKKAAADYAMMWVKKEVMPKVTRYVLSIILWQLHERYGFGKKRLQQFFAETAPMINGMLDEYNWNSDKDAIWLCEHKLRTELGIDLSKSDNPFTLENEVE